MPTINLNLVAKNAPNLDQKAMWKSTLYAKAAVHFCALASIARKYKFDRIWLSLYATAIELSLKSLALRLGATPKECFGHKVTKLVNLIVSKGGRIPLNARLYLVFDHHPTKKTDDVKKPRCEKDFFEMDNDERFEALMIDCRYPDMESKPLIHNDFVGLISELLEAQSPYPFFFAGGGARAEIEMAINGKHAEGGMTMTVTSLPEQAGSSSPQPY